MKPSWQQNKLVDAQRVLERYGLPSAPDSERLVLGSVIEHGRDFMDGLRFSLDETSFSTEANRLLWDSMCSRYDAGESIDMVLIARGLLETGKLETVGGMAYLAGLDSIPAGISIESHVRTLQEKATLRQAAYALNSALARVLTPDAPSAELLAHAQELIERVSTSSPATQQLESTEQIITQMGWQEFCMPSRSKDGVALPEKWSRLTEICPVLRPGNLVVLAARTSAGKSAMALDLAVDAAMRGIPVVVYTLEMSKEEWAARAACNVAKVDSYRHQNQRLDQEERTRFQAATTKLMELSLFFYDSGSVTVPAIHAQLQRHRPRPKLVIVDYLQLVQPVGKYDKRAMAVSEISRSLKRLATTFKIPVVALSQFSRDNAKDNREPELHDLKESGDIENDANLAIFIHPKGENDKAYQPVTVSVKKHRNGRLGRVDMTFEKPFSRFVEAS